ncbi:MAG: ComF family protein [Roseburia sp.]|nr:ComF family protein [Roseburia sp.]
MRIRKETEEKGYQKIWNEIRASGMQLLFPLRCPVCDGIVPGGEKICLGCMEGLKPLAAPWCMRCGKALTGQEKLCRDCRTREHRFLRGRALYQYESAAPSIYRFKYGGRREYADFFGEEVARGLGSFIGHVKPEGLIPIPLHKKRERKRGYNQAGLLARAIGTYTGLPVYENLLVRIKNTSPLKEQNPKERQNNLKKAFKVIENDVKLKKVIVVDDIYTTGSTVDEAAGVLEAWGVEQVYFIALACGKGI